MTTVVFFGTPKLAAVTLEMLASRQDFDIRLVITRPDKPAGRGQKMEAPPLKLAAECLVA